MPKIDLDKVPSTLEDAVSMIVDGLDEKEIKFIKENNSCSIHHGFGKFNKIEDILKDKFK